jgi:hypothetical protein
MGGCDEARILIAFGVGLLLLSGLGAAVSWAYAVRVVRASHRAMREVNALQAAYRLRPCELRELPSGRDSTPPA